MKKETRGRKPKMHKPIDASFKEVLSAIGKSEHKEEQELKDKKK
jgi:hypothetical protein